MSKLKEIWGFLSVITAFIGQVISIVCLLNALALFLISDKPGFAYYGTLALIIGKGSDLALKWSEKLAGRKASSQ